jgi:hypothetical protein
MSASCSSEVGSGKRQKENGAGVGIPRSISSVLGLRWDCNLMTVEAGPVARSRIYLPKVFAIGAFGNYLFYELLSRSDKFQTFPVAFPNVSFS